MTTENNQVTSRGVTDCSKALLIAKKITVAKLTYYYETVRPVNVYGVVVDVTWVICSEPPLDALITYRFKSKSYQLQLEMSACPTGH